MSNPKVKKLIARLADHRDEVRWNAVLALGEICDVAAVPALMEALKDKSYFVSMNAAIVLGKIGEVSAVPALLEAMRRGRMRHYSAEALWSIGDSLTLPRKILAEASFSPQQKIEILAILRRVRYPNRFRTLRFIFLDTHALCETVLRDGDTDASEGAREVLDWLNEGRYLLRASQYEDETESNELLRPVEGSAPETQPETLLRAANVP